MWELHVIVFGSQYDERMVVLHRKRSEQKRVDDAENRGIRSDSES
jgi:hypothetical protein